jgi:hypothetical protein
MGRNAPRLVTRICGVLRAQQKIFQDELSIAR